MKEKFKRYLSIIIIICMVFTMQVFTGDTLVYGGEKVENSTTEVQLTPIQTVLESSSDEDADTSGTCGENATWLFDKETATLYLNGEGVVKRGKWGAFADQIRVIHIGKGITSIPDNIELVSKDSLLSVLEKYEVEDGNTNFSVSDGVLFNYDKTVLIKYPIVKEGSYHIPSGVFEIGSRAFAIVQKLTKVTMSDSVKVIGSGAFESCKMTDVEIGKGVKTIETRAFTSAYNLKDIIIPENVESIGDHAFAYCSWEEQGYKGLQSVIIMGKNTKMDSEVFRFCTGLTEATVACNLGVSAFAYCKELRNVTIMDGVTSIHAQAFWNCDNIVNLRLPDSLEKIGNYAFDSSKLTEFYLPANLRELSEISFQQCTNLNKIIISEANHNFVFKDGILYDSTLTKIIRYLEKSRNESVYEIPAGITSIGAGAFYGCNNLTEIIIPYGVKEIGKFAFEKCTSLKSVVIPEGVKTLLGPMFSGSNALEYIVVPESAEEKYWGSYEILNHLLQNVEIDLDVYTYFESDRYKYIGQGISVNYNATGGKCNITKQTVYPSKPYENIPIPQREGYTFKGWYTQKDGGRKITEYSIVDKIADYTLYAHWEKNEEKVEVDDLSYSFGNSRRAFNYSSNYRIPLEIYENIWGKTVMAQNMYRTGGTWGGSCYGMAATSGMFNTEDSNVKTDSFKSGAKKVRELQIGDQSSNWNINVREFIETMFVSQRDSLVQRAYSKNEDELSELCRIIKRENELVLIAVFGKEGGHALLGYRLEDVDDTTAKLYVYDCNFPLQERYIRLTKDGTKGYTGWYYHLNDMYDWGSEYEGSSISYVPYDTYVSLWDNSALKRNTTMNLLYINISDASIKNTNGKEVARLVDNKLQTDRNDIIQVKDTGITSDNEKSGDTLNLIYLPTDTYIIQNLDTDERNFDVSFVNSDFGIQATTTADEITVQADDDSKNSSVYISAEQGETYEMRLETSLGDDYRTVQITGAGEGQVVGAELENGLISLTNCSEDQMFVEVNGSNGKYYMIETETEGEGTISPSGTYYAVPGSSVIFTMHAAQGYKLEDVLVNGKSIGAVNQYELDKISSDCKILAKFKPEKQDKLVENIKLNITSVSVQDKGSMKLEATVTPENATNKELKWSSEDPKVAMVDNRGIVTAVGVGKTTIVVEAMDGSNKKASCVVTVTAKPNNGGNSGGGNSSGGNSGNGGSSGENSELIVKLSYYIVSFDANGGKNLSRKTMTLLMDDSLGILPKVQRENYRFKGWYTEKTGGKKVTSTTVLNASTTLYAHWEKIAE